MKTYRVSIRFSRLSDSALKAFASNIINSMTGNAAFPTPLIPLAQLTALQNDFANAIAAASDGGQYATAVKNSCRAALLSVLRRQAVYVESIAKHDLSMLLSSGFTAVSRNNAQSPLPKPAITKIMNEHSAKLTLRVTPVVNSRSYQVQVQVGQSEWQDAGIYPQARRVVVEKLKPGTLYNLRVRAIGGSTGSSDWSDPTSRMSL
jgi:hypothetical protein